MSILTTYNKKSYIQSKYVRVFPTSFRGTYTTISTISGKEPSYTFDPEARLTTEANLRSIPGNQFGKDSYLISYGTESSGGNTRYVLKFVIGGYYFEIFSDSDFKEDLAIDKYFYIKTASIQLTNSVGDTENVIDSTRYTEKLIPITDETAEQNQILDIKIDGSSPVEYAFLGLGVADNAEVENASYSLGPVFVDGKLNLSLIKPKLLSGSAANSITNAVKIETNSGVQSSDNNKVTHENSIAYGKGLSTTTTNQAVFGRFNGTESGQLIVGTGTSSTNKKSSLIVNDSTTTINDNLEVLSQIKVGKTTFSDNSSEINSTSITLSTGSLTLSGPTTINGNTTITGDTEINGNTTISGRTIINGIAEINNNATITGTLTVNGKTAIRSSLEATGLITKNGELTLLSTINPDSKGVIKYKRGSSTASIILQATSNNLLLCGGTLFGKNTDSQAKLSLGDSSIEMSLGSGQWSFNKNGNFECVRGVIDGKLYSNSIISPNSQATITISYNEKDKFKIFGITTSSTGKSAELVTNTTSTEYIPINIRTIAKGKNATFTAIDEKGWTSTTSLNVDTIKLVDELTDSKGTTLLSISTNSMGRLTFPESIKCNKTITANDFNADSDARLKENITPFKYDKSILHLPVYKYNFIGDTKTQIGCIAQELKELYPELVTEQEDGYLSIKETKLVYLLLEEVKKLKQEIEELKQR